jgi:hypothetical protein
MASITPPTSSVLIERLTFVRRLEDVRLAVIALNAAALHIRLAPRGEQFVEFRSIAPDSSQQTASDESERWVTPNDVPVMWHGGEI